MGDEARTEPAHVDGKVLAGGTRLPRIFWLFWSCLCVGSLADGMTGVAVPWVAASLTSNAVFIAGVAMASRLPWLLLSLPAGVVADRVPRLALVAGSDGVRAVVMAVLGVLLLAGSMPVGLLLGFAFVLGVTEVLAGVAGDSAVPILVDEQQLTRANGHVRASEIAAVDFLGRPIGGALLRLGSWVPFIGDAFLTGVGALLLMLVRRRVGDPRPNAEATSQHHTGKASDGFQTIMGAPQLRVLLLCALGLNTCYGALLGAQVLFAKQTLGLGNRSRRVRRLRGQQCPRAS